MPSFDVVYKIDLQEVDNAVNQTLKEVGQRFDFKGTPTEVRREATAIHLRSADDFKVRALADILARDAGAPPVAVKSAGGAADRARPGGQREAAAHVAGRDRHRQGA